MEAQPSSEMSDTEMVANIGSVAIAICQQRGFGLDAFVNLMRAYRFAKDSYELGSPLDFGTVCRLATYVTGLSTEIPLAVLFRDGPLAPAGDLRTAHGHIERLERLVCDLRTGMEADAFLWKFQKVAPFRSGNRRVAWIVQNWLDDTMEDPELPRQLG